MSSLFASPTFAASSKLSTPDLAVALAVEDLQQHERLCLALGSEFDPTPYRYVWVQNGSMTGRAAVSFTANSVLSRSSVNYVPNKPGSPIQYVANGLLVRLDLRRLVTTEQDFTEVVKTWDKIRNPFFTLEDLDGHSVFGPHVDGQLGALLQEILRCENPIVAESSFHIAALTQIDGGLYYEFKNVPKANEEQQEKGKTDFDLLLKKFGINDKILEQTEAEQRVAQLISDVTGKPRQISFFNRPAPTGRIQGWISITFDTLDTNRDPNAHAILSLGEAVKNHDGTEVILEENNGHLLYLLYDGDGKLADVAPPDLVRDSTIPAPHTNQLQPAISCIRCHGGEKEQGWKAFSNDVLDLTDPTNGGLLIIGDASQFSNGLSTEEAQELTTRLFSDSLQKPLRRAREDQQEAVLRSTFGAVGKNGRPWIYSDVAKHLTTIFLDYFYTSVGVVEACRDLGYELEPNEAKIVFNGLVGTLGNGPLVEEDPLIHALKIGRKITRRDWEDMYIAVAARTVSRREIVEEAFSELKESK